MIKIYKITNTAKIPTLGTEGAAGYDLFSDRNDFTLFAGTQAVIQTGIAVEMWPSIYGDIKPRSGIAARYSIQVLGGVIDSDYRGEIKVILFNLGYLDFHVLRGQAIAQIIFTPVLHGVEIGAGRISETVRGASGFGSAGNHE